MRIEPGRDHPARLALGEVANPIRVSYARRAGLEALIRVGGLGPESRPPDAGSSLSAVCLSLLSVPTLQPLGLPGLPLKARPMRIRTAAKGTHRVPWWPMEFRPREPHEPDEVGFWVCGRDWGSPGSVEAPASLVSGAPCLRRVGAEFGVPSLRVTSRV